MEKVLSLQRKGVLALDRHEHLSIKRKKNLNENLNFSRDARTVMLDGSVEQSDKGNQVREELRNELFKMKSIMTNGSDEQRYQGTQGGSKC